MSDLSFDLEAMEGDNSCSPACENGGVCQNSICFCESPHAGDSCQDKLDVHIRVGLFYFFLLCVAALVVGFLIAFALKFCYDSCCGRSEEDEAAEEESDEDSEQEGEIRGWTK